MLFQKQISPKNLSINEMWNLYKIIGSWKGNIYLVDEVLDTLKNLSPESFLGIMHVLYDQVPENNPTQMALMFINGLKHNEFFSFQRFMEEVNGRSK